MNINTKQIDPNAFGYTPTFPEGSDGISSFLAGFQGARDAGVGERSAITEAADTGVEAPKPSYFNRFSKGVLNAPGVRARGADPFADLKVQQFQQSLATKAVELQGNELTNRMKLQMLTDTLEDQRTFGAFQDSVNADPTILSTGELPAFRTPQYRMAASQQQLMYSRGVLMEKNKNIIVNHQKGLAELASVDPAAYATISAMEDKAGLPSPEAMNSLSEAMTRNKIGVKVRDIMPEQFSMKIGDKDVLGIRNPQTGSFQIIDPDKLSQTDLMEYRQLLSDRSDTEKLLDQTRDEKKRTLHQTKIKDINGKISTLLNNSSAPSKTNTPPGGASGQTNDPLGLFK